MVPSRSTMKCAHVPGSSPRSGEFEANVFHAQEKQFDPV